MAAGGIREPVLARYTRQLLEGLAYLHSKEVMHRDIKVCEAPCSACCLGVGCQPVCRPQCQQLLQGLCHLALHSVPVISLYCLWTLQLAVPVAGSMPHCRAR